MAPGTQGDDMTGIGATDPRGRIFIEAAAYTDDDVWHATATELRAAGPIHRFAYPDLTPFHVALGHAEVMEIERNSEIFTNEPMSTWARERISLDEPKEPAMVNTLINMDGEEHRSHRALVNDWFKPGAVRQLEDQIREQATRSVDEMERRGGSCDFAADIAVNYPLRVILDILGLDEAEFPRVLRLTQELFGANDPDFERDGEDDQMMAVIMDMIGLFTGLNAERRANPTHDLATVIANGAIDGVPLDDMDTYGYYLIVATAGHDTTSNAIAGGLDALLRNPDQLQCLLDDPDLVDGAVDEIVRWVSPVKHFMRSCQQDHTLASGTELHRGDWILLSYASANRDERVFDDPFRFDIDRTDADKHLGFGFGRHYCLGAHIARLEIRALFRELFTRLDHIERTGPTERVASILVSGPKRLPVTYAFKE